MKNNRIVEKKRLEKERNGRDLACADSSQIDSSILRQFYSITVVENEL